MKEQRMFRRAMRRSRTAAMLVGCGLLGVTGGTTTFAAFNGQGSNAGNSVQAGSVSVSDNDNGVAMMGFSNALPGTSDTSCITVTYNGSLSSNVRLYGTTGGTGLAQYMNLTVTRGTYSATPPAYDSCTNFVPDATNYTGAGNGVIYNGTLEAFADSYAAGLTDPTTAAQETWTSGESHVYRFVVSVQENAAAEGKTATQSFTWEARNL